MTQWLAGMRVTEDRLNDHAADETASSGVTAATNWAVTSFDGKKVSGITSVSLVMAYSGATITATSAGNITDTLMATLPVGWRPSESVTVTYESNGTRDGSVTISTAGNITLRTMSPTSTLASGSSVTMFASWISQNG